MFHLHQHKVNMELNLKIKFHHQAKIKGMTRKKLKLQDKKLFKKIIFLIEYYKIFKAFNLIPFLEVRHKGVLLALN